MVNNAELKIRSSFDQSWLEEIGFYRALSARSVIASIMLPMADQDISANALLRICKLFEVTENNARVALSRMTAKGELSRNDTGYRLSGRLSLRQHLQKAAIGPKTKEHKGFWLQVVFAAQRRSAKVRSEARTSMARLHFGELREGVWLRPDNIMAHLELVEETLVDIPETYVSRLKFFKETHKSETDIVTKLWDLNKNSAEANASYEALNICNSCLRTGDPDWLVPSFKIAAHVMRFLLRDPLLPKELYSDQVKVDRLRATYGKFEIIFTEALRKALSG